MNQQEQIVDLFHKIIAKFQQREKKPHDFGTGDILYRFELHTIDAIYKNPNITVSELSENLFVTKGAISQIITKLIKKGFITRVKDPISNKKIFLTLTQKGTFIAEKHIEFHKKMMLEMAKSFGKEQKENTTLLLNFLKSLDSKF